MPVIIHDDGLHKLYVGEAGRGRVSTTTHFICLAASPVSYFAQVKYVRIKQSS